MWNIRSWCMLKKLDLLLTGSICLSSIATHWKPAWFLPFVYVRIPRNRSPETDPKARIHVQRDPRRNWKGTVKSDTRGSTNNCKGNFRECPQRVGLVGTAPQNLQLPQAQKLGFHSYNHQSLAKGVATSGTLVHHMWGENGTSSPPKGIHGWSPVLEVRIRGTQNLEERCMEIGKG